MLSAVLALLAGCSGGDQSSEKIGRLERRVAQLEEDQALALADLKKTVLESMREAHVLVQAMTNAQFQYEGHLMAEIKNQVGLQVARLDAARSAPGGVTQRAVARPVPVATKAGIPAEVYDQIAADAAKKWPGNFEMQEYTIKGQVESYLNLRSQR